MSHIIWLTGISGSGKTTIAEALKKRFELKGKKSYVLDGDKIRDFFEGDLGYKREQRIQNVKRVALLAKILAENEVVAIVANMAPYYEVRDFLRRKLKNYVQVYLKASTEKCAQRDVKGHYAKALSGEMENMVGVDDQYDVPRTPDLILDTDTETVEESTGRLVEYLVSIGVV